MFQVGSTDKIPLNAPDSHLIATWEAHDESEEMIVEDDLLEADDLERPVSSSLKGRYNLYLVNNRYSLNIIIDGFKI